MREDSGIYLDRLIQVLNAREYEELSNILYSYEDETIKLSEEKKKRVEKILNQWRKDVVFIEATSKKNKYNGYQDIYIFFSYTNE